MLPLLLMLLLLLLLFPLPLLLPHSIHLYPFPWSLIRSFVLIPIHLVVLIPTRLCSSLPTHTCPHVTPIWLPHGLCLCLFNLPVPISLVACLLVHGHAPPTWLCRFPLGCIHPCPSALVPTSCPFGRCMASVLIRLHIHSRRSFTPAHFRPSFGLIWAMVGLPACSPASCLCLYRIHS